MRASGDAELPPSVLVNDGDKTAEERDRSSEAHDVAAEARDVRSDTLDARADRRDRRAGRVDAEAAADRARASRDRTSSADDRRNSRDDRYAAAADRGRAQVERASSGCDALTGAYQRATGLAELEREIVKARRTSQPFVLAFLDIDGLKTINDGQGHAAGDQVLVDLVRAVRGVLREYDLVIRWGGDEFLCGLASLSLDTVADRFANTEKVLAAKQVAFSVGLAELRSDDTLQSLIARADAAMYERRSRRRADA